MNRKCPSSSLGSTHGALDCGDEFTECVSWALVDKLGAPEIFHAGWISLLGEGGDIVTDNVKSGFRKYVTKKSPPWDNKNIGKYLVAEAAAVDPEAAKNWHREKMKAEAEHQKNWEKRRATKKNNLKQSWDVMSPTDLVSVDDGDTSSRSQRAGTAPL